VLLAVAYVQVTYFKRYFHKKKMLWHNIEMESGIYDDAMNVIVEHRFLSRALTFERCKN
jgi:hypothetical protein